MSEEIGLFPQISSGFPKCSSHPPEKGEKGRKRAEKADFGRFPRRAARHPLSPHLLHPHLRQPKFSRIVSGFPSWTPFLRIALRGAKHCESQVWGDLRESLARYENRPFFLRTDLRESPRFALRIAGPSKPETHGSWFSGRGWGQQLFSFQTTVGSLNGPNLFTDLPFL